MSHSGNNSSRRLRHLPGTSKPAISREGEQLYNPSVFRYKCIGYLNLNSGQAGSPGVCQGLQSKMERVANMVPDTREAAIRKFLDAADNLGTYVDTDEAADQKVKAIYTSRTMIYKDDTPVNDNVNSSGNDEKKPKTKKVKASPFPEEDLIDKTEWNCYGNTLVHYLVLDPIVHKSESEKRTTSTRTGGRNKKNTSKQNTPSTPPPTEYQEIEKRTEQMFDDVMKRLRTFDSPFQSSNDDEQSNTTTTTTTASTGTGSGNNTTTTTTTTASTSSNSSNDNSTKDKNKEDAKKNGSNDDNRQSSYSRTVVTTKTISSSSLSSSAAAGVVGSGIITAITPENTGLSVRKIDSEVGHFTVADIGSIRICLESSSALLGDKDDTNKNNNTNKNNDANTPANKQRQQALSKAAENSMRPNVVDGVVGDEKKSNDGKPTSKDEGEEEPKRTVDLKKFYAFTVKVAEKMNQNVHDVKDAVSEDFPGRTFRFGTKVVSNMGTTTEQTFTYMGKLLGGIWKS